MAKSLCDFVTAFGDERPAKAEPGVFEDVFKMIIATFVDNTTSDRTGSELRLGGEDGTRRLTQAITARHATLHIPTEKHMPAQSSARIDMAFDLNALGRGDYQASVRCLIRS